MFFVLYGIRNNRERPLIKIYIEAYTQSSTTPTYAHYYPTVFSWL